MPSSRTSREAGAPASARARNECVVVTVKGASFWSTIAIVVGLVITFGVAPKLGALAPAPGAAPGPAFLKAQKALDGLSAVNALFGLAILGLVSAF